LIQQWLASNDICCSSRSLLSSTATVCRMDGKNVSCRADNPELEGRHLHTYYLISAHCKLSRCKIPSWKPSLTLHVTQHVVKLRVFTEIVTSYAITPPRLLSPCKLPSRIYDVFYKLSLCTRYTVSCHPL
jgi:hypothetical protein